MWIALLYFAFGIFAILYGRFILKQRRTLRSWSNAPGKILERKVDRSPGGRAGRLGPPAYQYEALVKYAYQVEGREYINDKIYRVGWISSTRKNREKFLATLPDQLPVLYNPVDPQDSCLLALSAGPAIAATLIGTFIALTAALYIVVTLLDRV
ncbi:MAG TPA: DUF3592 domain-containing protein [bacterium]|nr:DUF3592 domain-containing protein [bacterium]